MSYRVDWIAEQLESSRSHEGADYSDPNNGISPAVLELATRLSWSVFADAKFEPRIVTNPEGKDCPGYILAQDGPTDAYVALVRVTFGEEREDGAGPLPGRLLDMAQALNAQPRVLRMHFTPTNNGTRIEYFGHDELERELKCSERWRRALIGRRTAREYLRLLGGKLSHLQVSVHEQKPGAWPKTEYADSPEERLLREIFKEEAARNDYPGEVTISLLVDTLPERLAKRTVSLQALLASADESDEHFIFTCACGQPECAGIWRGIETVHEDGLVVWRTRCLRPRRVVVFDREQYRREILTKVRQALAAHEALGPEAFLGANDKRTRVEEQLYRLES